MTYPSNSNRNKETQQPKEREKLKQIASVKTKPKSGLRKFADAFIEEDVDNVKSYVIKDVLVPSFKKAIWDLITGSLDMFLGGSGKTFSDKRRTNASRVSYNSYYGSDRRDTKRDRRDERENMGTYDYADIIYNSRGEAEEVLYTMNDTCEQFGSASISDLLDLVGITGEYTDNNYGWFNLSAAEIKMTRDGYVIRWPRHTLLK